MQILIQKDEATVIPKDCTEDQAAEYAAQFPVTVLNDDGSTTPYDEYIGAVVYVKAASKKKK